MRMRPTAMGMLVVPTLEALRGGSRERTVCVCMCVCGYVCVYESEGRAGPMQMIKTEGACRRRVIGALPWSID